ncbi:MAG TPA: helix-turn-helix transcriptional regulator [Actinocrinis sp.]|nr:helix-turn-helix transcriptional regulator [Actinocrinis sp.]
MLEPEQQTARRKSLAEVLKELRVAAGLSGDRLAVRCAMSQTKISRIETGKVLPSVIDVERILQALEVPEQVAHGLLDEARRANVDYASWRAYARIGLWQKQTEIKALEAASSVVRQFLPAIPSGLLQTPDYARLTLTPAVKSGPARDVERAVHARLDRQEVLRDPARRFVFLMPEHAVRWRRAPLAVMADQVRHMIQLSALPNVEIAIIPQDAEVLSAPLNGFVLYDDRLVVIELFSGEVVLRDPRDITHHDHLFEYFYEHALTGSEATALLEGVADEFMRLRD